MNLYAATASALCYSILKNGRSERSPELAAALNETTRFILQQNERMPDFLRLPFRLMTIAFGLQAFFKTGLFFHWQEEPMRWAHLISWKASRLGFKRDFVRYYESLSVLHWQSGISK